MEASLIKVFVLLPFSKTFDYTSHDDVSEGDIVLLEFGKFTVYGVVFKIENLQTNSEFNLKPVKQVILKNIFSHNLISFIKLSAKYNCSSIGMFLRLSFPFSKFVIPIQKTGYIFKITKTEFAKHNSLKSKLWKELWKNLEENDEVSSTTLEIKEKEILQLTEKGLINIEKITINESADIAQINLPKLSIEQEEAFLIIKQNLYKGYKSFLLDGETGSGKTEVYFYLIKEVWQAGGQVLLMLPEIALSSTILERFQNRFGFEAILWHSSVAMSKKTSNFLNIINGNARVIIGTRSALFLPFKNLQLIIVDEEHDSSYKQEDVTVYHGRDMAVMRAFHFKIPIVLGSATPSIESYNNVLNKKYTLVSLKNRFFVKQMPKITIVDMKVNKPIKGSFISPAVLSKLLEVLKNGGQAMLFLNRRGYAPIVVCAACGEKIKCKFCDVHLTEHRFEAKLKCHHCGFICEKPEQCKVCGATDDFRVIGAGVERIKEEIEKIIEPENIILLTSDTLSSIKKTEEAILKIETGISNVIIGTQVISKGYHFKGLKFVAILDADFGLNVEDFRAFEKTFQLLYQVAGRTGRETADGEVYIQTYDPKNKVLFSIANYEKENFYSLEVESRFKFKLPPFSKQIGFIVSGQHKEETLEIAKNFAIFLESELANIDGLCLFGPSIPIISFLRGKFRFRILIFSTKEFSLQERILKAMESTKITRNVSIKIDVDPISFW